MKTFLIALKALFYLVAAFLFFGSVVFRVRRLDLSLGVLPTWTEIPGITLVAAEEFYYCCALEFLLYGGEELLFPLILQQDWS